MSIAATPTNERLLGLGVESAPGQEVRQELGRLDLRGDVIGGVPVDFSHGDVDAFAPLQESLDALVAGYCEGGSQAYTEYRGKKGSIRVYRG